MLTIRLGFKQVIRPGDLNFCFYISSEGSKGFKGSSDSRRDSTVRIVCSRTYTQIQLYTRYTLRQSTSDSPSAVSSSSSASSSSSDDSALSACDARTSEFPAILDLT
ncbi:hypothetical protein RSAG8_10202, partial [Rhizoctonia solani AG-8 WAC10335]